MTDLFKLDTKSTPLLDTNVFRKHLIQALQATKNKLIICSGFVTYGGVKWVKDTLKSDVECTILTFWNKKYLLEGSSDLKAFEICRDNNWQFRVLDRYHGKTMQFDDNLVAVGSGNLTDRGIGLIPASNKEAGIFKELSPVDKKYFDNQIESSKEITNDDYEKLKKWYEENKLDKKKISYPPLPISLEPEINIDTKNLWVDDFPSLSFDEFSNYKSNDDFYNHELDLFDMGAFDQKLIKDRFKDTYIYKWTMSILKKNDNRIYYGAMTDIIHNSLLDDARQYRRDVKRLQSNLYSYFREYDYDGIKLSRPNHSELLELIV